MIEAASVMCVIANSVTIIAMLIVVVTIFRRWR